ncbi:molybdopterin synthase catalytic subunit [Pedobacter cryoconitis]|uniref:molybdenum cofactor biosynthesis protein MoaE n=1 Tax=Pedobacter cryoconitis TaxID=188932 RepID=UPI00160AB091|nr:molybdenum cofactor biosynthesis protein MoaE [Pedobacter cryoconitis]MBB6274635.1 molybdopterin synthase catalytic subunit [Pedobacter cryoconitis]
MKEKKLKNIFINGAVSAQFIAESIQKHQHNTAIGAHSIFLGQVRADQIGEEKVAGINYTAYEEMALNKMYEIREAIFEKYPVICLHVHHSLGLVPAGEVCLFVFCSSVHRKAAMEACDELVERIKAELPIWGKEILTNAAHQWKENK